MGKNMQADSVENGPRWTDSAVRRLGSAGDRGRSVCFNCQHWQGDAVDGESGCGEALNRILATEGDYADECRRFPPLGEHGWQLTRFMDHCGEWLHSAYWRDVAKQGPPPEPLPKDWKGTVR